MEEEEKSLFWNVMEDIRCCVSSWGRENHFVFGEQLSLSFNGLEELLSVFLKHPQNQLDNFDK